ncbi:type IVB secretion system protein IcmH/DotU [Reinekea marinisedimentorum]|uniref:Type VI secretion system protein ImpK n=1 Tax=Reinekea marinisedimentorum TaxID=230495 RepID=A0A4R3IAA8_9GAMM|nr:type IVB secretion system protein IcmH/DotU [Reinekea marinisedimentorum]TCS41290.1 type VI secretion system protein ImpK [Reinekea marinisedimentorum]
MPGLDKPLDSLIVEVCSPIFTELTPLQVGEQADRAVDNLREIVEKQFVMLERRLFECQIAPEITRDIKFAMAAFSDEVVLTSRWQKKYEWMARPLAIEFFGDSAIGENFFIRLDELRAQSEPNKDVLQLYYSALILGFQGKYRLSGYDQLQAYIAAFRIEIEKFNSSVSRVLADNASPESLVSARIVGGQSYWVMAVVLVAAVLGMTIFYSTKMQEAIGVSAEKIEVLANSQVGFEQAPAVQEPFIVEPETLVDDGQVETAPGEDKGA